MQRVNDESLAHDNKEAAKLLEENIADRWKCRDGKRYSAMIDFLKEHEMSSLIIQMMNLRLFSLFELNTEAGWTLVAFASKPLK